MATKGKHLLAGSFWGRIGIIVFLGYLFSITSVEAAITVQSFSGGVKVLLKDESTWKPLPEKIELKAGDQILTEKGGSVDLLSGDGSTFHLDGETQLAINELEFSKPQKTRVSRLKLFWGSLTAKAATLVFNKNVFEVETDTVVAGFRFSSMTIKAEEGSGTTIIPLDGKLEFKQLEGNTQVDYTSPEGVVTTYTLPATAQVLMDITPDKPFQMTSNVAIPNDAYCGIGTITF